MSRLADEQHYLGAVLSSRVVALARRGWSRAVVRIPFLHLVFFACWFVFGMAAGLDAGWQPLLMWILGLLLFAIWCVLVGSGDRTEWYGVTFFLGLMVALGGFIALGDWYLRLFGERVTATVLSQEKTVDPVGDTVYKYRLARPDGRPLTGRLESYEDYRLPADLLVTVDPLGVLGPRERGSQADEDMQTVTLICYAVWIAVEILDQGIMRRRGARIPAPDPEEEEA
ncbi:hypothetical protein [Rhizohabitans arisaemae]|uniref:hypothetical protein n=1 Tax=Rhizohabitans arisaemae TaxID=2720610 RepID=UPI0024B08916|nr:hypothetical protein [Rhizohabitans arisaemae]